MPWTNPKTWITGEVLTASDLNTHLRDNTDFLNDTLNLLLDGYILIQDQKAANTNGGTFTSGDWRTRDLNTEVIDPGGHASLSANQITLAAGTYLLRASAPANWVVNHKTRWQNITDGTTTLEGTSEAVSSASSANQTRSFVIGRFTIAASKTFELQHQCSTTRATDGFGEASNFGTEIYSIVELWRIK